MRNTLFAALALAATLLPSVGLRAQYPVPRPASELTITQADGTRTLVSSYKGKVVVIQFLFTSCPHCQRLSQELTRLAPEFNGQVQMLGVAFDNADAAKVRDYVKYIDVGFPVGYADRNAVMTYLGLNDMTQRIGVPQMVVIDRQGVVREQSDAEGGGQLGNPAYLKPLLTKLATEPAVSGAARGH